MIWYDHSKDIAPGSHAILGASTYSWLNYDEDKLYSLVQSRYANANVIGTLLHELAAKLINNKITVGKNEARKIIQLYLLDNGIPRQFVDPNKYVDNFVAYVKDCIGFDMRPEQALKYSEFAFGTTDAIIFNEKKSQLKIFDYKSGVTQPSLHQLEIYAALFCLEYHVKPKDISTELRIYWQNDILVGEPTAADIVPIMDKIVSYDQFISKLVNKEE